MARNIFSTFLLGHDNIVAVMGANHLVGVEAGLDALNDLFMQVVEEEGHHWGAPIQWHEWNP